MSYSIISGDSHVDLRFMPETIFVDNADPSMVDKMPYVVETENGKHWMATGTDLGLAGHQTDKNTFSAEMDYRHKRMLDGGFFSDVDKGYHPTNAELRILDQERDGVEAEVLYGLLRVGKQLNDRVQVNEIFRIYNDWAAQFCKENPGRFAGLACVPNHDPNAASIELERSARIGLKGADFGVGGFGRPIYHKDWEILWETANDTGLPISFHTTGLIPMKAGSDEGAEYDSVFHNVRTVLFQLSGAEFVTSTIISGICERYPNFKFVLGECGVSWLPYVLDRMDHECDGMKGLTMKPSEYWARQGYTTFQYEPVAGDFIPMIGADNVIWGSDYPHQDGVWPDSLKVIEECLGRIDPEHKRKVICENTAKLYGFEL
jgi:predicted TIM-barrel fold metal-dependent hydrolase